MADIPKAPVEYLDLSFDLTEPKLSEEGVVQNNAMLPFAVSALFWAPVVSAEQISSGADVKKVYDLCLDIEDSGFELTPGDTIGICPRNDAVEVEELLKRLGVKDKIDSPVEVSVKRDTTKKNASVPNYVPKVSTLRNIFESCLDLHAVPKKLFIRALLDYTSNLEEQKNLEELCSRKSDRYTEWVSSSNGCLEALLRNHPSCFPPVSLLLEHLPRLQPRPYSIAHRTGKNENEVHIAFSLAQFYTAGSQKSGVCTGWLEKISQCLRNPVKEESSICDQLQDLSVQDDHAPVVKVPVFVRKSSGFHLPSDPSRPIIMIGPGVGVAPFIGFLQQREKQCKEQDFKNIGETWLLFGCRYPSRDTIYSKEVDQHCDSGVLTRFLISYSRDNSTTTKYVQDNIRLNSRDFCRLLLDENASFFICGDKHNMARDVLASVIDSISKDRGMSKGEAQLLVMDLQAKGHYKEDVWTIQDDVVRMFNKVMADEKKRQAIGSAPPPQQRHQYACDMV